GSLSASHPALSELSPQRTAERQPRAPKFGLTDADLPESESPLRLVAATTVPRIEPPRTADDRDTRLRGEIVRDTPQGNTSTRGTAKKRQQLVTTSSDVPVSTARATPGTTTPSATAATVPRSVVVAANAPADDPFAEPSTTEDVQIEDRYDSAPSRQLADPFADPDVDASLPEAIPLVDPSELPTAAPVDPGTPVPTPGPRSGFPGGAPVPQVLPSASALPPELLGPAPTPRAKNRPSRPDSRSTPALQGDSPSVPYSGYLGAPGGGVPFPPGYVHPETPTQLSAEKLEQISSDAVWAKVAVLHSSDAELDVASRQLIAKKAPPDARVAGDRAVSKSLVAFETPLMRRLANLQRNTAIDTVRNEYLFHRQIHQWLAADQSTSGPELKAFNQRVYAQLFLTPDSDPWLGLMPPDAFLAIENNGMTKK
ncbi:MAG: hypothetical protein SGJ20_19250, partial [Planctomycetota bacterium]|nr:hypothetical protein [Planctomycetota bacterium]